MKTVFFILASLLTFNAFAFRGIEKSNLSPIHQQKIESAILKSCTNLYRYRLIQRDQNVVYNRVDQGIVDKYFTTYIEVITRIDQIEDHYIVVVKSSISDAYDHQTRDWGIINVESINGNGCF